MNDDPLRNTGRTSRMLDKVVETLSLNADGHVLVVGRDQAHAEELLARTHDKLAKKGIRHSMVRSNGVLETEFTKAVFASVAFVEEKRIGRRIKEEFWDHSVEPMGTGG